MWPTGRHNSAIRWVSTQLSTDSDHSDHNYVVRIFVHIPTVLEGLILYSTQNNHECNKGLNVGLHTFDINGDLPTYRHWQLQGPSKQSPEQHVGWWNHCLFDLFHSVLLTLVSWCAWWVWAGGGCGVQVCMYVWCVWGEVMVSHSKGA